VPKKGRQEQANTVTTGEQPGPDKKEKSQRNKGSAGRRKASKERRKSPGMRGKDTD